MKLSNPIQSTTLRNTLIEPTSIVIPILPIAIQPTRPTRLDFEDNRIQFNSTQFATVELSFSP